VNRHIPRFTISLAALLLLALSGCRIAEQTVTAPVRAVVPGNRPPQINLAALQTELQRFADEYIGRGSAALDEYARQLGTPEAHQQALRWKVASATAAVTIASGPNPQANLLDFLALTTVTRTALEEVWTLTTNGPAFQPWLAVSRSLETNAWNLAEGILTPEQQQEMRTSIRSWWDANLDAQAGFFVRPQEFSSLIRQTEQRKARPGSVFGFVGLDPTAGLDPAVREVTRTRLFAERAMFMVQRMPILLSWQIELMTAELLSQTQVAATLESAERLSHAMESISQSAADLPDRITTERNAILDALETKEGKLRELSAEVTRTLVAGEKMSTSLNTTLVTFDALMKRFGVGEPATSPPDTNSPPFNILDYAQTAEQITLAAQQLDQLIQEAGRTLDSPALDKRIENLNALANTAKADAKSVLNHAFLLGAGLIVLGFACALVYRRLASRLLSDPAGKP
jgi:hypothetical protein